MAKDRTPDALIIVNDNFTNENHEQVAHILEDKWDASTTVTDLAAKYDGEDGQPKHSRSIFHKVYKQYMGVPESLFSDGIHDRRTIEQIKRDHGKMKAYLEAREDGELDADSVPEYDPEPDPDPDPKSDQKQESEGVPRDLDLGSENEDGMVPIEYALKFAELVAESRQEGYEEGFENGYEKGYEKGYEAKKDSVEGQTGGVFSHPDIFEGVDEGMAGGSE